MSLITPDFGLLFWMTIVFLIVLGIVSKFGFKVIVKMVNDRKDYIDSSLQKAHEANKKLANIKVESDALLQEARERQAAATRDAIVEKAQDKAHEESNRLLTEAKVEIENQRQAAVSDIRKQVATLSVEIAEKVLREKLGDEKTQMDLIERMLDEISLSNKK